MNKNTNIYPVFEQIINKEQKETLLNQKAKVLWFTGLSGAGKTTLGAAVEKELYNRGFLTQILDGDNIRSGINKNLKFTEEDRIENIRRIAEVTKLFLNCGVITINCFISPTKESRDLAKQIVGKDNFIEVYVSTPIEVCEARDTKGLYAKARSGEIKNFTGISSLFEPPINPDVVVNTAVMDLATATEQILNFIINKITTL
jgi:adenylylsulfate kinase